MSIPLQELKDQLATVQAAIDSVLAGNRLTSLRVGSSTFSRLYTYQELSLDSLTALRDNLLALIHALEPATPVFKTNATIPLVVGKDIW